MPLNNAYDEQAVIQAIASALRIYRSIRKNDW